MSTLFGGEDADKEAILAGDSCLTTNGANGLQFLPVVRILRTNPSGEIVQEVR